MLVITHVSLQIVCKSQRYNGVKMTTQLHMCMQIGFDGGGGGYKERGSVNVGEKVLCFYTLYIRQYMLTIKSFCGRIVKQD